MGFDGTTSSSPAPLAASAAATCAALAEEACADGSGRAVFEPADITSDDDWARVVARARTEFGAVHVLVNNAAIYQGTPDSRLGGTPFAAVKSPSLSQ